MKMIAAVWYTVFATVLVYLANTTLMVQAHTPVFILHSR
jgi:hypothetical protein